MSLTVPFVFSTKQKERGKKKEEEGT